MLYKVKGGSNAYEYIRSICEAEKKEYEAYIERVKEVVGFDFEDFSGYTPNSTLFRKYEICKIIVSEEVWNQLDKKVWRKTGCYGKRLLIAPNKRVKQGKAISAVFASCKEIVTHWDILLTLDLGSDEHSNYIAIIKLLNPKDGLYFISLDDHIRADKCNPGLEEITRSEYERLIEEWCSCEK